PGCGGPPRREVLRDRGRSRANPAQSPPAPTPGPRLGHNRPTPAVPSTGITPATTENTMGMISLVWGILAMIWMVLALLPIVGITNWLLIPFAPVRALIAAVGLLFTGSPRR